MNKLLIALGIWRAVLIIQGQELPFNFEVSRFNGEYHIELQNGPELIPVEGIRLNGDSLIMHLSVYDAEIRAEVKNKTMTGKLYNTSSSGWHEIPFTAAYGIRQRFITDSIPPTTPINGKWECYFQNEKDSSLAIGLFEQNGNKVNGTFLTSAGDYRFLEGVVAGDSLKLSAFDGAFIYLFLAKVKDGKLTGDFYSGNYYHSKWSGVKNDVIRLPDPYSISKLKPGVETLNFRFPDIDSNLVEFPSERFRDKVTIVQLAGSWCPNCIDESKYFDYFLKKNPDQPVAITALMFERTSDFSKAIVNIKRFKSYTGSDYPLLFAGDRKNLRQLLPEMDVMGGYPTTIILDKKGKIRKVHTGFNGPATGVYFVKQKEEFEKFVNELMAE